MTWAEFKAEVEQLGVKDDHEIWYLDLHPFPGGIEAVRQVNDPESDEGYPGWKIT